jgi:hypothetical protein
MTDTTQMPDRRCFRYRLGEKRIFLNPESVPEGEGWVDSPAKVRAAPEKAPEASPVEVCDPPVAKSPPEKALTSEAPKRSSRKPRA